MTGKTNNLKVFESKKTKEKYTSNTVGYIFLCIRVDNSSFNNDILTFRETPML
jgi:hypothetical protein